MLLVKLFHRRGRFTVQGLQFAGQGLEIVEIAFLELGLRLTADLLDCLGCGQSLAIGVQ